MKVSETTQPVQRTWAMEDLSELELRVVRTALSDLIEKESGYRKEVASHSHSLPQSQEELAAIRMVDSIRALQAVGFPPFVSDGHGQINAGKVAPHINTREEF